MAPSVFARSLSSGSRRGEGLKKDMRSEKHGKTIGKWMGDHQNLRNSWELNSIVSIKISIYDSVF
jgi:hypothetical protein